MLCFIIFHWPVIKKIFSAWRKYFNSFNRWRLHAQFRARSISICNRWELEEFKTTCKLVFNRFWKPLVPSLYFLYKCYIWTYVIANKQKNISTLKYAFLIQIGLIIFLFLPFKQFISSWSLWSNSTHLDEPSQVENSKACWHAKCNILFYSHWRLAFPFHSLMF